MTGGQILDLLFLGDRAGREQSETIGKIRWNFSDRGKSRKAQSESQPVWRLDGAAVGAFCRDSSKFGDSLDFWKPRGPILENGQVDY